MVSMRHPPPTGAGAGGSTLRVSGSGEASAPGSSLNATASVKPSAMSRDSGTGTQVAGGLLPSASSSADLLAAAAAAAAQLEAALAGAPSPKKGQDQTPDLTLPSTLYSTLSEAANSAPLDTHPLSTSLTAAAPSSLASATSAAAKGTSPAEPTLAASLGKMLLDVVFPSDAISAPNAAAKRPTPPHVAQISHSHKPSVDFDVLMNVLETNGFSYTDKGIFSYFWWGNGGRRRLFWGG